MTFNKAWNSKSEIALAKPAITLSEDQTNTSTTTEIPSVNAAFLNGNEQKKVGIIYVLVAINRTTLFFSFFHQAWKMVLLLFFYPRFSKGHLISKGLFGILNSSKKRKKVFDLTILKLFLFSFVFFWRIEGTKKTFRN